MPSVLGRLTLAVLLGGCLVALSPRATPGGENQTSDVTATATLRQDAYGTGDLLGTFGEDISVRTLSTFGLLNRPTKLLADAFNAAQLPNGVPTAGRIAVIGRLARNLMKRHGLSMPRSSSKPCWKRTILLPQRLPNLRCR